MTVRARLDRLGGQFADIRERLARLEASRDADRAQMQADLARFKTEVERAELQLTRLLQTSGGQPDVRSRTYMKLIVLRLWRRRPRLHGVGQARGLHHKN